jgi:PII-like signaling protein
MYLNLEHRNNTKDKVFTMGKTSKRRSKAQQETLAECRKKKYENALIRTRQLEEEVEEELHQENEDMIANTTTTTTATNQVQDATDNNSEVDPSETNDAIAEAQVAAPGGYESDDNNLGRYYIPYTQIMTDSTLLQAQIATEETEAIEGNRTPIDDPVDTLTIRESRKRKTRGSKNWRQVKNKENKRFENELHKAIDKLIELDNDFSKWDQERCYKQISESICSYNHDEPSSSKDFLTTLINTMKPIIRKTLFHPLDIIRAMDLSGGILSYEAIKILRKVETNGVRFFRGIIPSTKELQRAAETTEKVANELCPITHEIVDIGEKKIESVKFDISKLTLLLFKSFGLEDVAKQRSVEIIQTMDGARLSKNENHTTMGVRLVDIDTRDPITSEYLFKDGGEAKIQSRDWCMPVQTVFCNETKDSMAAFRPQFDATKLLSSSSPDNIFVQKSLVPPKFTACGDMSNRWKALGCGGRLGVAGVQYPCECCPLRVGGFNAPNSKEVADKCLLCLPYRIQYLPDGEENPFYEEGPPPCYHHVMVTENNRSVRQAELQEYLSKLNEYKNIVEQTKINYNDDPLNTTENKIKDPKSIHFNQFRNDNDRQQYIGFLNVELHIRGLSQTIDIEEARQTLKQQIFMELRIAELKTAKARDEQQDTGIFRVMDAVPCLLHAEMRVYIKIITMLFIEGLSNATVGKTYQEFRSKSERRRRFINDLQNTINDKILGSGEDGTPANWRLPLEGKSGKEEVGSIGLIKNKSRPIVESAKTLLLSICVTSNRRCKWETSLDNVTRAFKIARKHEDYTDSDITTFQHHCDKFFGAWVYLHGENASTNYIHYLSSGHLAEYMKLYRSLFKYSQESWEALNNLIKCFYFRRTQRGGSCGRNGKGKKSKLKSIGRWYQRRTLFICGYTKEDILGYKFEEEQQQQQNDNNNNDDRSGVFSISDGIPNDERLFPQMNDFPLTIACV